MSKAKRWRQWGLIIIIGSFAVATYLVANPKNKDFCTELMKENANWKFFDRFQKDDEKTYGRSGFRYGTETQQYKKFKSCANQRDVFSCWKDFNATKVLTNGDAVDMEFATGAILTECALAIYKPKPLTRTNRETIIEHLNKRYPLTSPDGIRIERVSLSVLPSGNEAITYHKTIINRSVAEFDVPLLKSSASREKLIAEACANAGVKNSHAIGISIRNIYNDKDNNLIYETIVHPQDCQ